MSGTPYKSVASKRGRKAAHYTTSWDEPIYGLARRPSDGRWRIIGTDITYTEPDERRALARFRAWEESNAGKTATIEVFPLARHSEAIAAVKSRAVHAGQVQVVIDRDLTTVVTDDSLRPSQWEWLRVQLNDRPKWVAERVGIEQIAYLSQLSKPDASPSLDAVLRLYLEHSTLSENWSAKVTQFWTEFCSEVGTKLTLRELTQEKIISYGDMVRRVGQTPTYSRQRFGAIKAVLNFPPRRGRWAEESARAVALCKCLVPPRKSAVDPKPIDKAVFTSLLAAGDDKMRAMLLLALNACMYGGEVAGLTWSELDLDRATLQTTRAKTGVIRIAVLWPRTLEALRKLDPRTDAVFLTDGTKMQHNYQTVYKAFKATRAAAKVADVQFAQIRDGAYTAAVEAGVDLNLCRLLAGHATGISDHYVKRRPQMVAAACQAIEQAYFG